MHDIPDASIKAGPIRHCFPLEKGGVQLLDMSAPKLQGSVQVEELAKVWGRPTGLAVGVVVRGGHPIISLVYLSSLTKVYDKGYLLQKSIIFLQNYFVLVFSKEHVYTTICAIIVQHSCVCKIYPLYSFNCSFLVTGLIFK